jgi:antitoxin component YwqK of YwqJK toxin-antitoxin module
MQNTGESPLVSILIQDRNGMTETISTPDRLSLFEQVDFSSSQPYKKVLRVYKQNGKHTSKITTYHSNGLLWKYLEAQDMRAFGTYQEWHSNGLLKIEARVIGGTADLAEGAQSDWLFEQEAKVFDEKGHLQAQFLYEKGILEGLSHFYYPNGQIQKEISYRNNQLHGDFLTYLPNGELQSKAHYIDGLKEGESLGFWPAQQKAWVEHYQEGKLLEATYYSNKGDLLSQIQNGSGFQALFNEAVLEKMVEYRKGVPEGLVKELSPKGELKIAYRLKNGKKQGEEIHYYLEEEGQIPKLSIPWEDNAISGIVKTWYNDGHLQSQREMARNQKNGSSVAWYRDGSLMYIEEYEEDTLTKGNYYKKNQREPISTILNGSGTATLYDEHGIFIRKVPYFKGKPVDPDN